MLRDLLGLDQAVDQARTQPQRTPHRPRSRASSWDPVDSGRLFSNFGTSNLSADEEVKLRLEKERARSRQLERENPWAVRYFTLYVQNVLGDAGIRLVPRVFDQAADGKQVPDRDANKQIRDAWARWGKRGSPTVDGRHSWDTALACMAKSYKRDGEALLRIYRGGEFGEFGYQVQLRESDHLPMTLNRDFGPGIETGHRIRMGIEFDPFDKPVAYWLNARHPGAPRGVTLDRFTRVPADEIIHLYDQKRIDQSRGLPSLEAGIARLSMLQGYEEAELVAARAGASKMGFIQSGDGNEYEGEADATYDDDEIVEEFSPGTIAQLGEGQEFVAWDPTHPNSAFGDFVKNALRAFFSVGGASYNSGANDLEGVNFSSLRDGKLTERDTWRLEQELLIDIVCRPVFESWLPQAMLGRAIDLPLDKLEKFTEHRWQGRRWEWVDPAKEATGHKIQLENRTTTVSRILESQGRDLRDHLEELALEIDLAEELGLESLLPYAAPAVTDPVTPAAPPGPPAPDEDEPEDLEDLDED
jgi:lambda family phage portal protein